MAVLVAFKSASGGLVVFDKNLITGLYFPGSETDKNASIIVRGVSYPLQNSAAEVATALGEIIPPPPP